MPTAYSETTLVDDEEGNENDQDDDEIGSQHKLNQIFYGPPGTGKTYTTVSAAVKIVEPEFFDGKDESLPSFRIELQRKFKEYLDKKQIVFCTFHQSFSYEDFVEGLRAHSVDGQLQYSVEDGIFKTLCIQAQEGTPAADSPFDKAVDVLMERCNDPDSLPVLTTVKSKKKFEVAYQGNKTFRVFPRESTVQNPYYVANIESVRKLYQGHSKQGMYNSSYVEGMLQYLREQCGLPDYVEPDASKIKRNFVIIIDEINRGNVSRILGELITLIEEDKRSGQAEELSITLPYSKDRFSIPPNVHIIGTMNSSDRSLSGIDIALRRRFSFIEMAPDRSLLDKITVAGINIGSLLSAINQRIEILLDRDHCIGHAYFLQLTNDSKLSELAAIFQHKIIPLLQEYFFEDWERVSWVLNDHSKPASIPRFITEAAKESDSIEMLFGEAIAKKINNKRWKVNESAFESAANFKAIISVAKIEP